MKKSIYFSISIFLLFVTVLLSCRDTEISTTSSDVNAELKARAKDYFTYQTQISTNARIQGDTTKMKKLLPNWTKTKELRDGSTRLLIAAADTFELTSPGLTMKRLFLFKEQNGSIVDGRIIELIGDENFISRNSDLIIKNYRKKTIKDFNGYILSYDLNYNYLEGFSFKSGLKEKAHAVIQKGGSQVTNEEPSGRIASTLRVQDEATTDCYGLFLTVTYSNNTQDVFLLKWWCTSYGGTGGGGTFNSFIDNQLTTPCLKETFNHLLNQSFGNEVQDILTSFNKSAALNYKITEERIRLEPETDGTTTGSEVTLNSYALANASKEYIAATIYHETLHVFLTSAPGYDHATMAARYVQPMKDALMQAFPNLGMNDAYALAWGGLQGYGGVWDVLSPSYQNEIMLINKKFKNLNNVYNHAYGSYCP